MKNWKESTLGEACELYQPKTISSAQLVAGGKFSVYGANGVIGKYDKCNHAEPQLLITCRGATCGSVNVSLPNSWINGNAMVVKPRDNSIELGYLKHLFQGGLDLTAVITGAAQPQITRQSLAPVKIRIPPIAEQRRIADILDRAHALRANRRAALARLDELTQAIFIEMFGHHDQTPITIGDCLEKSRDGWTWALLTDVSRLATGHTPDRKCSEYWGGDIPWVTLTDIRKLNGTIAQKTCESVTEVGIENSSAVKLPAGTVCFSRTASVGFVTVMGKEMATSQDFVNWVCGPKLDPIYLMNAFLLSRERLRSLSTGSTHKTIYFPTVERFRALVPPMDRQIKFRRIVEKITTIKAVHQAAIALNDSFFASLQDRAFRGVL